MTSMVLDESSFWFRFRSIIQFVRLYLSLADPRGGARDARPPPWGSKFFHFHAVFGKNVKNNSNFGSWRPPLGKILDPPLLVITYVTTKSQHIWSKKGKYHWVLIDLVKITNITSGIGPLPVKGPIPKVILGV